MFFLSLIELTLRLPSLDLSLNETIKRELESQFLDKVIANLGLCVSVYDIRSIDGDFVFLGMVLQPIRGSEVKHDLLVALWDDNLLKPVLKHHMSDMTLTRQL
ncbi:hypothetical protein CK203_002465 [Vitis vinifera]|uniref:RNA polymerase Rpb7-like N-terminal domain-containing protein n=1 Tax=Vitis vinifera TaxID=29760 RepID=A0A438KI55_VITVI|nr:hypothetical protein CK203_002465 [Vitis vinifera]